MTTPLSIYHSDPHRAYDLLDRIGKGSYGQVFKARHKASSALVAVKTIDLDSDGDGDVNSELTPDIARELEMLAACRHTNIVAYRETFLFAHKLWIAMEYCGGGSVRDLYILLGRPLSERVVAVVCREAAQGLAYLHSHQIVHRDIKGGNILLTDGGAVKLADFGVAAQLKGTLKKRNTFVGTPYWTSPEVIQEQAYDGRADVWSLGVVGIEMAEQAPPRASIHPMRVLFKIVREPPPSLAKPQDWSPEFQDFLAKCLVKSPERRSTASELLTHSFIQQADSTAIIGEVIQECREVMTREGYSTVDDVLARYRVSSSSESASVSTSSIDNKRHSQQSPFSSAKRQTVHGTFQVRESIESMASQLQELNFDTIKPTKKASVKPSVLPTGESGTTAAGTAANDDHPDDATTIKNVFQRCGVADLPVFELQNTHSPNENLSGARSELRRLIAEADRDPVNMPSTMANLLRVYERHHILSTLPLHNEEHKRNANTLHQLVLYIKTAFQV